MTTAKDLFIIAMDSGQEPAVGQGDLSLALAGAELIDLCLLYTSPSPRDGLLSRMPSSA